MEVLKSKRKITAHFLIIQKQQTAGAAYTWRPLLEELMPIL